MNDRNLKPIATICHNDDNASDSKHRRVTLYAGTDGYVWAAADEERQCQTDCEIGHEAEHWAGTVWDFKAMVSPRDCSTCHGDGTYWYNLTGKSICTTCGHNYNVNPSGRAPFGWHL